MDLPIVPIWNKLAQIYYQNWIEFLIIFSQGIQLITIYYINQSNTMA